MHAQALLLGQRHATAAAAVDGARQVQPRARLPHLAQPPCGAAAAPGADEAAHVARAVAGQARLERVADLLGRHHHWRRRSRAGPAAGRAAGRASLQGLA